MLGFIAARALPASRRSTRWAGAARWRSSIAASASTAGSRCASRRRAVDIEVAIAPSLLPAVGALSQRLRHALDLDADPALIALTLASLPVRAGLRVPGSIDGFETAVRVVLGQQVTVAAARTLTRRLVDRFGEPIETPFADLTRLFPSPQAIAEASADAIGKLGIVRQRVRALQALAREVADGRIALHRGVPLDATLDALRALPGIGEWTVQLIALRALAWPDAFPASDIGVLNALRIALGTRRRRARRSVAAVARLCRHRAVANTGEDCMTTTTRSGRLTAQARLRLAARRHHARGHRRRPRRCVVRRAALSPRNARRPARSAATLARTGRRRARRLLARRVRAATLSRSAGSGRHAVPARRLACAARHRARAHQLVQRGGVAHRRAVGGARRRRGGRAQSGERDRAVPSRARPRRLVDRLRRRAGSQACAAGAGANGRCKAHAGVRGLIAGLSVQPNGSGMPKENHATT